jgi:predicted HTH transcriptional regulator
MPIAVADLTSVSEATLTALIGITENETLEFKKQSYGGSDGDRRELCKDVSALANSTGGDIILGVEETDGVASSIVGLKDVDVGGEIQRRGVDDQDAAPD